MKTPTLVVFCGRSGTGKTTLAGKVEGLFKQEGASPVISTTTRPRRINETSDEYEFITEEEFLQRKLDGKFAWHVEIETKLGKIYHATESARLTQACEKGISILILTPDKLALFASEVAKRNPEARTLFFWVRVDDEEILLQRLTKRDGREAAEKRLSFDRHWPEEIQNYGVRTIIVDGTRDPDTNAGLLASRIEVAYYNLA